MEPNDGPYQVSSPKPSRDQPMMELDNSVFPVPTFSVRRGCISDNPTDL